ncbi:MULTISPECIES: hypothetical protein [Proteus]|uniref:Uncharacterized protein n=3 Tax=Proteus mirabilis TaxID=584 RepID=A0AAJ1DFK8_PROMI|nr:MULTISPECIES: hypothetical protein [Proteus]ARX32892.1 hypothetical protein AM402_01615 [Proteus mirabilis]AUU14591.1 hypothetical protein MC53_011445 [Proteus mirabilis]AXY99545.1 hypothetical protein [Proteus mirabilis]EHZ8012899.1 hypothetical protein [Proteus mirabilis]EJD6316818.1 hypothetical protein [Proteus mirabilis]
MKYLIFSGWWCDNNEKTDKRNKYIGDDSIRDKEFHKKWYDCINKYTSPEKILIIDSNSPIKPDLNLDPRIELLSLNNNFGHSTNHEGTMCGYTRSCLLGIYYAFLCDLDYCIYIEQDSLIKGNNIIEEAIKKMKKPYMFGSAKGTPNALQQSFFIIRKDGYIPFLTRMNGFKSTCNKLAPENKFAIATSSFLSKLPECIFYLRGIGRLLSYWPSFDILPFGYGRSRPINFNDQYLYFQHGSVEELERFKHSANNDTFKN